MGMGVAAGNTTQMVGKPTTPQLLTVFQVADALNVSHWTVRRLLKNGVLPAVRIGSRVLVKASDLNSFIDQRTTTAADQADAPSLAADEEMG
jgi:excisionase family DNA binding protein